MLGRRGGIWAAGTVLTLQAVPSAQSVPPGLSCSPAQCQHSLFCPSSSTRPPCPPRRVRTNLSLLLLCPTVPEQKASPHCPDDCLMSVPPAPRWPVFPAGPYLTGAEVPSEWIRGPRLLRRMLLTWGSAYCLGGEGGKLWFEGGTALSIYYMWSFRPAQGLLPVLALGRRAVG